MKIEEKFESDESEINEAVEKLIECHERGGKLLVCGNGGSCADADHIVDELMKGFLKKRPLYDVLITAPENETYKIQELHLLIYHYLCAAIENTFCRMIKTPKAQLSVFLCCFLT